MPTCSKKGCSRAAVDGFRLCPRCRAFYAAYVKRRRARLKADPVPKLDRRSIVARLNDYDAVM